MIGQRTEPRADASEHEYLDMAQSLSATTPALRGKRAGSIARQATSPRIRAETDEVQRVASSGRLIARLGLATVIAQQAAVYVNLFRAHAEGAEMSMALRALGWSPLLLAVIVYIHRSGRLPKLPTAIGRLFWLSGLVFAVGVALSPTHAAKFYHVASDLTRFSTAWIGFFLLTAAFESIRRTEGTPGLVKYVDAYMWVALLDAVLTIALGLRYWGAHFSTGTFVYGLVWSIVRQRGSLWKLQGVFAICAFAAVIEGKRTTMVMAALAIAGSSAWLIVSRAGGRMLASISAAGLLALIGLLLVPAESRLIVELQEKVVNGYEKLSGIALHGEEDRTLEYRHNEIRAIHAHFSHPGRAGWCLTGLGFGAEINPGILNIGSGNSSNGMMHHAHNAFAVYFLRNGLLGWTLLATFIVYCLLLPIPGLRESYRDSTACCWLFLGLLLVAGYTGNLMLESVELPFVAALAMTLGRSGSVRRSRVPKRQPCSLTTDQSSHVAAMRRLGVSTSRR